MFAFAKLYLIEYPPLNLMLALSVFSIILATLSWFFVERPFRNSLIISRAKIFIISACGIAFFSLLGSLGHLYSNKFEIQWLSRQTLEVQNIYKVLSNSHPSSMNWGAASDNSQKITECVFNVKELNEAVEEKIILCREEHGEGLLILGDSHAIDLFGLVASRKEHPFLIGITQGGCRPHDNFNYCHYKGVSDFINSYSDVFYLVLFEQAGFYLLRNQDGEGSRSMFTELAFDEAVTGVTIDEERIRLTSEYLYSLSKIVKVNWFLPRAEHHISNKLVFNKGCDYHYSYRPNMYEVFNSLDRYIEKSVKIEFGEQFKTVSQNNMLKFNFPNDFINCENIYWSDGDHFSASG